MAYTRFRTFDGKQFSYHAGVRYKDMARTVANRLRREGKLARIVKVPGENAYAVYTRKG